MKKILFASLLLVSCVTPLAKRLDDVKVGMLKDEVLDVAGSPTTKSRHEGRDRWFYKIPIGHDIIVTEVAFVDGKCVYKGEPVKPAMSADEQDKWNLEYNRRADKLDEQELAKKNKSAHMYNNSEE